MISRHRHNGFVVVVVLCMVLMLAVLLLGFSDRTRADLTDVDQMLRLEQALNCARAGLNIAIAAVTDVPDTYFQEKLGSLLSGERAIEFDGGECLIGLAEENGKINLNMLKTRSGQIRRDQVDCLLRIIDIINRSNLEGERISYSIVPAIIDWIDADDEVTCLPFVSQENLGAEAGYYGGLSEPYECRNGPLETVEELVLVKGITRRTVELLEEHVTVNGDGKLNINSASKTVVECLSEKMDPALAEVIVERRRIKSFKSLAELRSVAGMTDNLYGDIIKIATTAPEDLFYRVTSRGRMEVEQRTIKATLQRNTEVKRVDVVLYTEF